jgi:uncharacterized protein YndB with AHSA1/START domain
MDQTNFKIDNEQLTVTTERVFNAPITNVWRAITDPALIPSWWGAKESPTVVDKMDVRKGGVWRFIRTSPEGSELAFSGDYLEVEPMQQLVQTFNFEPSGPGHESTRTTTLETVDDTQTKMTTAAVYKIHEDLKADLDAGMEAGTRATWERLAALIATLNPR